MAHELEGLVYQPRLRLLNDSTVAVVMLAKAELTEINVRSGELRTWSFPSAAGAWTYPDKTPGDQTSIQNWMAEQPFVRRPIFDRESNLLIVPVRTGGRRGSGPVTLKYVLLRPGRGAVAVTTATVANLVGAGGASPTDCNTGRTARFSSGSGLSSARTPRNPPARGRTGPAISLPVCYYIRYNFTEAYP